MPTITSEIREIVGGLTAKWPNATMVNTHIDPTVDQIHVDITMRVSFARGDVVTFNGLDIFGQMDFVSNRIDDTLRTFIGVNGDRRA